MYCKDCKNMGEFMLVERFYPDEYLDSTYSIDFAELAKKGYRGVLFDIDNTLVPHGAPADQKAKALFAHLRELGMDYCLISNNQLPRVKPFADAIGGKYIEDAHKPSTKNYRKAMQMMGCTEKDSLFVGDQLFTDVWGAKRAGMHTILVKPIHPKKRFRSCSNVIWRRLFCIFIRKTGKKNDRKSDRAVKKEKSGCDSDIRWI